MNIKDLGYNSLHDKYIIENKLSDFTIGRVTQENRERYIVSTGESEYEAEITGNLRFTATSRADFPAVGDWVTMMIYDAHMAIIYHILPRKSVLERQAVAKTGEKQIISANIDVALIIQAINNNFNINRLERYLAVCYSSDIEPVLVISKTDLSTKDEIDLVMKKLNSREKKIKYILLSNVEKHGLDQILMLLQKGKTYCVVGSSGVGKSTLINNLLKEEIIKTGEISRSTNKGRHITSRRELFVLDNGAIVIDTPGMKELGITENPDGITTVFEDLVKMALECRYPDCTHTNEKGCSILDAVERGEIDRAALENYKRLQREQQHFQATLAEKRKKDKEFGKMVKTVLKEKKRDKYGE